MVNNLSVRNLSVRVFAFMLQGASMSVIGKVTLDKNTEVQARINPGVCVFVPII